MSTALIHAICAAFDDRDAETLLRLVADDVNWPNGPDNPDRPRGETALRCSRTQQWRESHTTSEMLAIDDSAPDRPVMQIAQIVRSRDGAELSRGRFIRRYRLEDGWAARLDIRRP